MTSTKEPTKGEAMLQMIAERAYQIWEDQGHPHGCDLIHWQQAEQEIMSGMEPSATSSADAQAGVSPAPEKATSAASPTS